MQTPTTSIFASLMAAAMSTPGFTTQQPGELEESFIKRVMIAINSVSDTNWALVPVDAQNWYNTVSVMINESKPIPPCPGFEMIAATAPAAPAIAPEKKGKGKRTAVAPPTAQPVDPNIPVVPGAAPVAPLPRLNTASGPGGLSLVYAVQKALIAQPTLSPSQVQAALVASGWTAPNIKTINTTAHSVKGLLKAVNELGLKIVKA